MLPRSQTECLHGPKGPAAASGVESSHIRGRETVALMPRKNLLSLFADFARFAGDVAVVQRRGYRREKATYTELYTNALLWRRALAGRGVLSGERVVPWGPNFAELVANFCEILSQDRVGLTMVAAAATRFV